MANFLDPLSYIRRYESGGDYTILFGGSHIDPAAGTNQYGFPNWAGQSNSHAAGAYQFEPATWDIYASRLAITDFTNKSQDAVAAACYAARGFADWQPYNTKLNDAIKAAGGAAAFSLGVSWLAGVTVAQPIPVPPPGPEVVDISVKDQSGKTGTATVTLSALGALALIVGGIATGSAPTPMPEVTAPIANPAVQAFDFSGSTFRFDAQGRPIPIWLEKR